MQENNAVEPYNFEGQQVRVVQDSKGEPWFVAKDVCKVLGLNNTTQAVSRLKSDEKRDDIILTDTIGRRQMVLAANEPGLYKLILRSDKLEAQRFQRWVTHEVLPSIRKTGGYIAGEEHMSEDELILKAMQVLQKKVELLHQQVEEQQPKVEAYDHLMNSEGLFNFRNTARILNIGEDALLHRLRHEGYLTQERFRNPF